jgi:hypothetical protein
MTGVPFLEKIDFGNNRGKKGFGKNRKKNFSDIHTCTHHMYPILEYSSTYLILEYCV